MANKPEPMTIPTALTLAVLVLDFEAETARASRAIRWAKETNEAAKLLRQLRDEAQVNPQKPHG